jgi:methylthioribose-1-phosphate isomerase
MRIHHNNYKTIWVENNHIVRVIDQTKLPHKFEIFDLSTSHAAAHAIKSMIVRGAPLIGVTAAYGLALAAKEDPSDHAIKNAYNKLLQTRPTAVNLRWALDRIIKVILSARIDERVRAGFNEAELMAQEDIACCESIGDYGAQLIIDMANKQPGKEINVLTHCNAGWLCSVDWGTALSPIYKASRAGVKLHVWVDETRPRNQGASLTAFELLGEGIPHTVIADNTGGHLMQHGKIDLCIVGSDRTTYTGDVCNKIGTYLKALAAYDNRIPFYVALPSSTIDWRIRNGLQQITIEERDEREVTHISGLNSEGGITEVQLTPVGSSARNYGFDVTPARLVSGLITERGVCSATEDAIRGIYPEQVAALFDPSY